MPKPFAKKTVGYVSPADQLLEEFDNTHTLSDDQKFVIKKYKHLFELRDGVVAES